MPTKQHSAIDMAGSPTGGLRFVTALKPEADPVIDRYEMKPVADGGPFRCWSDAAGSNWLVVSGIGKTASAAAATWLQAVSGPDPSAAWLNLGIAGHPSLEPGTVRRIHKVADAGSGRSWYPPQVVGGGCGLESATLITVDRPAVEFPDEAGLVDMEGSGFVEAVSRFTSLELVLCVKVVSDNAETGFEEVKGNRRRIANLAGGLIEELAGSGFFETVEDAAIAEARRLGPPAGFDELVENVHFSESQRHQLRRLLQRCAAIGLDPPEGNQSNARGILSGLESLLADAHQRSIPT